MNAITQTERPNFLRSLEKSQASQRNDWWIVAILGGLLLAMLTLLVHRVDPQTRNVDEQIPSILID